MSDESKPCPCGAEAAEPHFFDEENQSGGGWGEVYCTVCSFSARGPYVDWLDAEQESKAASIQKAIEAWNNRADTYTRAEVEDAVKRALEGAIDLAASHYPSAALIDSPNSYWRGVQENTSSIVAAIRALDPAQFIDGDKP